MTEQYHRSKGVDVSGVGMLGFFTATDYICLLCDRDAASPVAFRCILTRRRHAPWNLRGPEVILPPTSRPHRHRALDGTIPVLDLARVLEPIRIMEFDREPDNKLQRLEGRGVGAKPAFVEILINVLRGLATRGNNSGCSRGFGSNQSRAARLHPRRAKVWEAAVHLVMNGPSRDCVAI